MKASLSEASTVTAAIDLVSTDLGNEAAILNLKSGVYYGLNSIGARVWRLIQQPRTISELRDTVVAEYEVDAATCERDLLSLLTDLAEAGLLEAHDAVAS